MNHLGNVLVVFTDKRIAQCSSGIAYKYHADLLQAQHYSAFGAPMPGLRWYANSTDQYKFGFNRMEEDDEIKGDGNSVDFGARIYDSRLGRWMSLDPLQKKYPHLSPYCFVANMPIFAVDVDGKIIKIVSDDPEYRKRAFADLQKQSNVQLVLLKDGTVRRASDFAAATALGKASLIEIEGIVTGKNIVDKPDKGDKVNATKNVTDLIDKKDYTVEIKNVDRTDNDPVNNSTITVTTPSKTTIYYDLNETYDGSNRGIPIIYNEDGSKGAPGFIILAHELIHAGKRATGKSLKGQSEKKDPDQSGSYLSNEEADTREKENVIRGEFGIKKRAVPRGRSLLELKKK